MLESYKNNIQIQKYKAYASAGYLNKGTSTLKVKYINKFDSFCQRCKEDLLQSELAEETSKGEMQNG